jgi:hypothetical protein
VRQTAGQHPNPPPTAFTSADVDNLRAVTYGAGQLLTPPVFGDPLISSTGSALRSVDAADLRPPREVPPIGASSWVSRLMLVSRPDGG